jgi:hypothetical protein
VWAIVPFLIMAQVRPAFPGAPSLYWGGKSVQTILVHSKGHFAFSMLLHLFPQSDTVRLILTKTLKRLIPGKTGNALSRTDCRRSSREDTMKWSFYT